MKNERCTNTPIIIAGTNIDHKNAENQCDACPAGTFTMKSENNLIDTSMPYFSPQSGHISLNQDFNILYGPHLNSNPIVVNHFVSDLLKLFEKPNYIKNLVPNNLLNQLLKFNLLSPLGYKERNFTESNDVLTALLMVTQSCNLNCDYCYMCMPSNNKNEMPFSTGYKIIDSIFNSTNSFGYKKIKIKYSGGEPLRCFPKIEKFHKYASKFAKKNQIDLQGSILSNGTLLTTKILSRIKDLNLHLTISLDGLNRFHDCQRHFSDGSSSFEMVVKAIELALTKDLVPDISITVTKRNIDGLSDLVEWVIERDLPFSINFYRKPSNEKHSEFPEMKEDEEIIISGILNAYQTIETQIQNKIIDYSLLDRLADRTNCLVPHLRPCCVGYSYMVFDCSGNLFKCQMQNQCIADGQLMPKNPLEIIRNDKTGVQNISVEEKQECKHCEWKYWCAGGCPLHTYKLTGRYDMPSPNCKIYKALFHQVIRLEGLRLLSKMNRPLTIV